MTDILQSCQDISDVDRERWESEPENIQYGLDYIKTLQNSDDIEKVITVCNELLLYDQYNKHILKNLAEAYQNIYREEDALNTYKNLARVDPADYDVAIDISKILLNQEKYQDALDWTDKAIGIKGSKGNAYYQRSDIYFSVAESCTGTSLQFWDKIVYEISWQDCKVSVNKGYGLAKARCNYLKENFITTIGDWHINRPENEMEVTPQGDCYLWIKRSVKREK